MAKVAYSKLNAKVNTEYKVITLEDEKEIEILQYLPINDKLDVITRVIELSYDPGIYYSNPLKTNVYLDLEIIQAYTNITFTEKQLENPPKLYDAIVSSGWRDRIFNEIPAEELQALRRNVSKTQQAYYAYKTSAIGVLEAISTDYSDLDLNVEELRQKLASGENIELVQKIITNLG